MYVKIVAIRFGLRGLDVQGVTQRNSTQEMI